MNIRNDIYKLIEGVIYKVEPRGGGITFHEVNGGGRNFAEHFAAEIWFLVENQLVDLARAVSCGVGK